MEVTKAGAIQNTIPMLPKLVITPTVLCPIVFAPWMEHQCPVAWTPKTCPSSFTSLLTMLSMMTTGNCTKKEFSPASTKIPMDVPFMGHFMCPMSSPIMPWSTNCPIRDTKLPSILLPTDYQNPGGMVMQPLKIGLMKWLDR